MALITTSTTLEKTTTTNSHDWNAPRKKQHHQQRYCLVLLQLQPHNCSSEWHLEPPTTMTMTTTTTTTTYPAGCRLCRLILSYFRRLLRMCHLILGWCWCGCSNSHCWHFFVVIAAVAAVPLLPPGNCVACATPSMRICSSRTSCQVYSGYLHSLYRWVNIYLICLNKCICGKEWLHSG